MERKEGPFPPVLNPERLRSGSGRAPWVLGELTMSLSVLRRAQSPVEVVRDV